jgi:hypothetical protein
MDEDKAEEFLQKIVQVGYVEKRFLASVSITLSAG